MGQASATVRPRHVVLIGLMGSGKTTVGRALAEALGRPFRDSDADLLAQTGVSARDLAARDGVDALHALELGHVLDALRAPTPAVISAAASVIDDPRGRAALAAPGVRVAWLRIDPATAAARMIGGDHRPIHEPLAAQAARRDPWFQAAASLVVDGAGDSAEAIVDRLADWVREAPEASSARVGPTREAPTRADPPPAGRRTR